MPLKREQVEIHALLRRVTSVFDLSAEQKGISLSWGGASASQSVLLDEERMVQALENLIANALRYTPDGGESRLMASVTNQRMKITVEDTGSGIAEADLSRIFERFYRADQSRNLEKGQSGLGLAITRAIIEAHGGEIAAESERGKGTKFSIFLPL